MSVMRVASRAIVRVALTGCIAHVPGWAAPEVFGGAVYNEASDIYSLGKILTWLVEEVPAPLVDKRFLANICMPERD